MPEDVEWASIADWFDKGQGKRGDKTGRVGTFKKTGFTSLDRDKWTDADWGMAWLCNGVYKFVCEELGDVPSKFKLTGALDYMVRNFPLVSKPALTNAGLANLPERIRPADNCMHKYNDGPGYYCTLGNVVGK
jgi:hypothetical protein